LVTDTNTNTLKCSTASPSGGEASKLTVGGKAVILDTVAGSADGHPPAGLLSATAGQDKLTAA
jgi:hypothetical protein